MTTAPLHSRLAAILILTWVGTLSQQAIGQISITEFLADNGDSLVDEDGDPSDWIEITNTGAAAIDLAGWHLSDDITSPTLWTFPQTSIAAGERLLVFASGKDRAVSGAELHTNFSLNSSGEYLALYEPGGTVVASEYNFPEQFEDIAFGVSSGIVTRTPVQPGSPSRYLVPTTVVPNWETAAFNDSVWPQGSNGIGYDEGIGYETFFLTDVGAAMIDTQSTCYARYQFEVSDPAAVQEIELLLRYDDGFVAYINGIAVASANAPAFLTWNSEATAINLDSDAVLQETFDLSSGLSALVTGTNVLAIQGMNAGSGSSDFLIESTLRITAPEPEAIGRIGYLTLPTPAADNGSTVDGFVADTKFSVNRGFHNSPINVAITSATPGAVIYYTTDGTIPTPINSTLYTAPVAISSTTTLRAIATLENYQSTNIDTQSYIFTADVIRQADMDPVVVNSPDYSTTIESDLSGNFPVISLVVNEAAFFGTSGIYSNPENSGRGAEVPVSMEFFDPASGEDFQVDAGIRIHGGNARSHPKKPLRLYFRSEYGPSRLRYPLYEDSPVDSFDQLLLRPGGHDSWSLAETFGRDQDGDIPPHGTLMRDQFLRKTENEMGLLSPHGRYTHVYINARYWGVYDLHERANAAMFESHLGGDEEDYDVLHHPTFVGEDYTVVDGDSGSYETARSIADGGVTSAEQFAELENYLDIDDYIDHLIVRMWSGDYDWCGPISRAGANVTVFGNKNWYAGRRSRGSKTTGFRFFTWDAEMSMGLHLLINLGLATDQRVVDFDLTTARDAGSPVEFYSALRGYAPFQLRFADRLQKHLFNDGMLTATANQNRWEQMRNELNSPIVAESARWGDEGTIASTAFTRNDHWLPEVEWLRDTFMSQRSDLLLSQFRSGGLYPNIEAPSFSQHGGQIASGTDLNITAPSGAIYATTDGSDPYVPGEVEVTTLIDESTTLEVLVPSTSNGGSGLGTTWRNLAPPSNAGSWFIGPGAVGYETDDGSYGPLINIDLQSLMSGINPTAFVRIPFELPADFDGADIDALNLLMKYDDGFLAWINGTLVTSSNAPFTPLWNSPSVGNNPDTQAILFENFDISNSIARLNPGSNMLAIQVVNNTTASSDLLCQPKLTFSTVVSESGPSPTAFEVTGPLNLSESTEVRARSFDTASGEWSALNSAEFLVGELASAANLVVSEFNYHPRDPEGAAELAVASSDTDFEFIELQNIGLNPIDLAGVSFGQGIDFEFGLDTPNRTVAPGAFVLLVENASAFEARYGAAAAALIAGEFDSDSKLSNNGESITINAADGSVIRSFRYEDSAPWPEAADGNGFSLVLNSPESAPDHAVAANWRASGTADGTPGEAEAVSLYDDWREEFFNPAFPAFLLISAPGADPDGDGHQNIMEYALGTNPSDATDIPHLQVSISQDAGSDWLTVQYAQRNPQIDYDLVAEFSSDGKTWTPGALDNVGSPSIDAQGRAVVTKRSTSPLSAADTVLLRLRAEFTGQ